MQLPERLNLQSRKFVDDNEWHSVSIERKDGKLKMIVDEEVLEQTDTNSVLPLLPSSFDINGGPEIVPQILGKEYVGYLRDIKYNSTPVTLIGEKVCF
jgi:hypothetical protein